MRRVAGVAGLLLAAAAADVWGAGFPFRGFGPAREPHPATVALREYQAVVRTNLGEMTLDLEPDSAPNAVRLFVRLAQRGAYDGLRVRCVFKDKMLVVGDAPAKGKAEGEEALAYEESPMSASAGAVLFDRLPDGGNCPGRILILVADQSHLDRSFTRFAEVEKGLDVAKRIGGVATRASDGSPAPIEDVVIEQILVTKKAKPEQKESKKP